MIYLIDTIGKEAGMNLYDDSFVHQISEANIRVKILSNYKTEYTLKLIHNFYKGSLLKRILLLIESYLNILLFYIKHRNNVFIYQSYGLRFIDILIILIFMKSKSFFVIVHDVFALNPNNKKDKRILFKKNIYKHLIKNIICHSKRTIDDLLNIEFKGNILYHPHFNYNFNKNINQQELNEDIIGAIKKDKTNILLFGQISLTKGIDIVMESPNYISHSTKSEINIIIAGMDKANLIKEKKMPEYFTKICRYINDSELNYLFLEADYILLPYKEIYQSGVLEVAIYFKKPVILSNLDYFNEFAKRYPSFSLILNPNTPEKLAEIIDEIIQNKTIKRYYTEEDENTYHEDHNIDNLIKKMNKILSKNKTNYRLYN